MPTFEHFPLADIVKEGVEPLDDCPPPPLSAYVPPDYADIVGIKEDNSDDDSDYYDYVQPTRRPLVFPATLADTASTSRPLPLSRPPPPPSARPTEAFFPVLKLGGAAAATTPAPPGGGYLKPAGFPPGLFGAPFAGPDPFSQDFFQDPADNRPGKRQAGLPSPGSLESFGSLAEDSGATAEQEEEEDASRYQPLPLHDNSPSRLLQPGNRKSAATHPYQYFAADLPRSEPAFRGGTTAAPNLEQPAIVLPPPLPPPSNFPSGSFRGEAVNSPAPPPPNGPASKPAKQPAVRPGPRRSPFESLIGPIRNIFSGGGRGTEQPRGGPAVGDNPRLSPDYRRLVEAGPMNVGSLCRCV
jgi:hypothetical protein